MGAGKLHCPGDYLLTGRVCIDMRRFAEVAKACVLDAATCAAGGFARETRDAWRAIADATRAPFLDRMNGALAADADAAARRPPP